MGTKDNSSEKKQCKFQKKEGRKERQSCVSLIQLAMFSEKLFFYGGDESESIGNIKQT